MPVLTVRHRVEKALVIGSIYDHCNKLHEAQRHFPNYDLIVFNGNLCYPNDNLSEVKERIEIMDRLLDGHKVIYNVGHYDLQLLHKLRNEPQHIDICQWITSHPNVIIVPFHTGNTLIITDGGITNDMTLGSLSNNIETSFVSKVKDAPWHRWYGGGLGYVISNNPLTIEPPQYYNFSTQMGNIYWEKTMTYAQVVNGNGLGECFSI